MTKFRYIAVLYISSMVSYYASLDLSESYRAAYLYVSAPIAAHSAILSDLLLLATELSLLAAVCYISRYRLGPAAWQRCFPR